MLSMNGAVRGILPICVLPGYDWVDREHELRVGRRKSAGFSSLIDARSRPQSDKQAKHSRPAQPNLALHASATDS
jgi:hypothetical protein